VEGQAGSPVAVVCCRAGGRPEVARWPVGVEFVEKLLTTKLTSTDTTEREAIRPWTRSRRARRRRSGA